MTQYAIFGKGRTVLLVKGNHIWMTPSHFSGILTGACALRYGYSGWGFRVSDTSHLEMNDAYDADHRTSILPWEV